MRILKLSLAVIMALVAVTACNGKSSSSSDNQSSAAASPGAEASAAAPASAANAAAPASAANAAGNVPSYPGAVTQASGSSSGAMGSAAGTVLSTDDSFDKVYAWYQQNLPAGSEKSHTTSPVESAVFTLGTPGQGGTTVTISTSGGKTLITIGKVQM